MKRLLINITNLSLSFTTNDNTNRLDVLNDISFTVDEGEFITIIGPSGCGKTTLLKLIGGLIYNEKVSGTILINGNHPKEIKKDRKIGFAFQNPVLLPWRNILENTLLPLELNSALTQESLAKAYEILSMMGVSDFSKSYPNELSGGMKQRVNLARALIHQPSILLMDEPFGSLDEITRLRLNFELLKMVRLKKQTSIFVTHSLREALLLGDKIIILSKRPATVIKVYKPSLTGDKEQGIETSNRFNDELRNLTNLFLSENSKK